MDRRIQKTRDGIYNAFSKLLEKKPYPKITIQNIIDEANIGRSTFYSHFETKDELLHQLCADLFEHISFTLKNEKTHNFSSSNNNSLEMISHILYHLKDNAHDLVPVLSCESSDIFFNYFKEFFEEFIYEHLLTTSKTYAKNVPDSFLVNHISSSFINMIKWWIQNDMQDTPETLTKYFNAVIPLEK